MIEPGAGVGLVRRLVLGEADVTVEIRNIERLGSPTISGAMESSVASRVSTSRRIGSRTSRS
jgi:hypothetical protein